MNKPKPTIIIKDCLKYDPYTERKRFRVWVNNDFKGHGNTEVEALKCALERITVRSEEYYNKYYDLIKRLNASGFILRESIEENDNE